MTAHKHSQLMLQYARDAMVTDSPWEWWEVREARIHHRAKWGTLVTHPEWNSFSEYRRKKDAPSAVYAPQPEPQRRERIPVPKFSVGDGVRDRLGRTGEVVRRWWADVLGCWCYEVDIPSLVKTVEEDLRLAEVSQDTSPCKCGCAEV